VLIRTRRFASAPELALKLLLLGSRLIGNHRSPVIAFATPIDYSITGHLLDLVGIASFPALLFRHPACRTISPHLTGPGHSAPHAITNACCGVAVETNNKWKSRFRHHADAPRSSTEVWLNPYEAPALKPLSNERGSRAPRNCCPICERHFSWTRRLTASFRCSRCNTRIGFKPQLKFTLPVLIVYSIPWVALWFYVKSDLSRLVALGYWLMLLPGPAFFGSLFLSQAFGKPTAYNGWWWASADFAATCRSEWKSHDVPSREPENAS
jgi:uncharacterized protein (DUF983 family)